MLPKSGLPGFERCVDECGSRRREQGTDIGRKRFVGPPWWCSGSRECSNAEVVIAPWVMTIDHDGVSAGTSPIEKDAGEVM